MKQIYDFTQYEPPRASEAQLTEQLARRELKRQTILLYIASLVSCVCYAVFAFFIIHDSVIAAAVSIMLCTVTLLGSGVISVVFLRHGMRDQS